MRLRSSLQRAGQNLIPAFPSPKGKPNTGSFARKRWVKLRAGRWLKRVSVSYPYNPHNYHIARNLSRLKSDFFIAAFQAAKGDEYLVDLAVAVDDLMIRDAQTGQ